MGRFPPAPLLLAPVVSIGSIRKEQGWEQTDCFSECATDVFLTLAVSVKAFSKFRSSSGASTHGCVYMVHCTKLSTEARQKGKLRSGGDWVHQ